MSSVLVGSQTANARALDQSGSHSIFSSRGTRWRGLVVLLTRRLSADCPHSVEASEPWATCILSNTVLRWAARGTRYKYSFRPGISVFLNEGYRLDELTSTTSHYDFISVRLERDKISELMHDDVRSTRVDFLEHVISNDDQMVGMLHAMLAEARAGSPAGDLFAQSISVALLTHLYDRYDRTGAARRLEGRLSPRQDEIISQYIKENIGRNLSITELANVLQVSPAYFCKTFTKSHGVTPHRFVLNERIEIAMERLQQPSAPPLAELARALGFSSQAHFSTVFRRLAGRSPSGFRDRVRR